MANKGTPAEDQRQLGVNVYGDAGGADKHYGRSDKHPKHHHDHVLGVGYVGSEPGDQRCGTELIHVGKRKPLHLLKQGVPEVLANPMAATAANLPAAAPHTNASIAMTIIIPPTVST